MTINYKFSWRKLFTHESNIGIQHLIYLVEQERTYTRNEVKKYLLSYIQKINGSSNRILEMNKKAEKTRQFGSRHEYIKDVNNLKVEYVKHTKIKKDLNQALDAAIQLLKQKETNAIYAHCIRVFSSADSKLLKALEEFCSSWLYIFIYSDSELKTRLIILNNFRNYQTKQCLKSP